MIQAVRQAEVEQAVLFWQKHGLVAAFRSWQGFAIHRRELKKVAGMVIGRICMSCQVRNAKAAGGIVLNAFKMCLLLAIDVDPLWTCQAKPSGVQVSAVPIQ